MTHTFNIVAAPSESRPQISLAGFGHDLDQAVALVGDLGIAGFTEIAREPWRNEVARRFDGDHRVGLEHTDCPGVWSGFTARNLGVDFGSKGIRGIAPDRHTTWAELEDAGLTVGGLFTHMTPGVWKPGNRWQRFARPLNRLRWGQHRRRIQRRINWLLRRCDVVVVLGDINHPGSFSFPYIRRVSGPGLMYVGVSHSDRVTVGIPKHHAQAADHAACAVTVTVKEKR